MAPARRTASKKAAPRKPPALSPRRVADRLHKTVCQSLTGARFLLSAIEHQIPKDAVELRKQIAEVDAALCDSSETLRALIRDLRSEVK